MESGRARVQYAPPLEFARRRNKRRLLLAVDEHFAFAALALVHHRRAHNLRLVATDPRVVKLNESFRGRRHLREMIDGVFDDDETEEPRKQLLGDVMVEVRVIPESAARVIRRDVDLVVELLTIWDFDERVVRVV